MSQLSVHGRLGTGPFLGPRLDRFVVPPRRKTGQSPQTPLLLVHPGISGRMSWAACLPLSERQQAGTDKPSLAPLWNTFPEISDEPYFSATVHGLPAEYPAFLAQCRLSLRESSATFAERKATLATRERLPFSALARGEWHPNNLTDFQLGTRNDNLLADFIHLTSRRR